MGDIAFLGACAVGVLIAVAPLNAQTNLPSQEPQLRIDPGMHTAPNRHIGVSASCTLLSDDKTLRSWKLPEGKRSSTLRPPIGLGHEGNLCRGYGARWECRTAARRPRAAGGYCSNSRPGAYGLDAGSLASLKLRH